MGDGSTIEWLLRPKTKPASWNPIRARRVVDGVELRGWHCEHVTEACRFCYSERQNEIGARGGTKLPYKPGHRKDVEIFLDEKTLRQPLHWRDARTVFPCSMTDLYGEWVPDEWLDKIKAVEALTPQHTYLELTKRPERQREYARQETAPGRIWFEAGQLSGGNRALFDVGMKSIGQRTPPANVWAGTSCADQNDANKFIPLLLDTPAAIRFVSLEPLLGPIDLHEVIPNPLAWNLAHGFDGLDWVIVGGESGPKARPMSIQWARELRDQCVAAGVRFFFKQWGEWQPAAPRPSGEAGRFAFGDYEHDRTTIVQCDGYPRQFTKFGARTVLERVGKKAAGRLLDGRTWDEFPEVRA